MGMRHASRTRDGLSRRALVTGAAALGVAQFAACTARATEACATLPQTPLMQGLAKLRAAYPDFIASVDATRVVWRDGFVMPVSLRPANRPMAEKIAHADLAAMVTQAYPKGRCSMPPDPANDPGRVRYEPFFARMYGETREAVFANLVSVRLPRGRSVQITRVNGVADRFAHVVEELRRLPWPYRNYFDKPAGGFKWRTVANTSRRSAHAYGFAVDINVRRDGYWRYNLEEEPEENWTNEGAVNRVPFEIVSAFERNGFIWGGKWHHYDTFHFEYRPELLL